MESTHPFGFSGGRTLLSSAAGTSLSSGDSNSLLSSATLAPPTSSLGDGLPCVLWGTGGEGDGRLRGFGEGEELLTLRRLGEGDRELEGDPLLPSGDLLPLGDRLPPGDLLPPPLEVVWIRDDLLAPLRLELRLLPLLLLLRSLLSLLERLNR